MPEHVLCSPLVGLYKTQSTAGFSGTLGQGWKCGKKMILCTAHVLKKSLPSAGHENPRWQLPVPDLFLCLFKKKQIMLAVACLGVLLHIALSYILPYCNHNVLLSVIATKVEDKLYWSRSDRGCLLTDWLIGLSSVSHQQATYMRRSCKGHGGSLFVAPPPKAQQRDD